MVLMFQFIAHQCISLVDHGRSPTILLASAIAGVAPVEVMHWFAINDEGLSRVKSSDGAAWYPRNATCWLMAVHSTLTVQQASTNIGAMLTCKMLMFDSIHVTDYPTVGNAYHEGPRVDIEPPMIRWTPMLSMVGPWWMKSPSSDHQWPAVEFPPWNDPSSPWP